MKKYVCGFMFSRKADKVALINKLNPEWQKGKRNGIGGKVDMIPHNIYGKIPESTRDAMVREFKEKTGVETLKSDWILFCIMKYKGDEIYFYKAFTNLVNTVETKEKEVVEIFNIIPTNYTPIPNTIHNLNWLIPMALDITTELARVI